MFPFRKFSGQKTVEPEPLSNEDMNLSERPDSAISESADFTPFPPLAVELVLRIMEIAARDSTPTALALALVSKAVHSWITPIIYHTVVLYDALQEDHFHITAQDPACDSIEHVHALSLFSRNTRYASHDLDILRQCTQVKRLVLALWAPWRHIGAATEGSWPDPWELVLLTYGFNGTASLSLPLRNVTHFHYASYTQDEPTVDVCQILPQLTHFGFEHAVGRRDTGIEIPAMTARLLSENPTLEMVLLHSWINNRLSFEPRPTFIGAIWGELAKIEDERLLARPGLLDEDFHELLKTGETIWDNASERFGKWREKVVMPWNPVDQ